MSTINVTINDHAAEFTNMPIISSGSINVDKIQFTFDDTWDNFTGRVCVFYKQRGQYWYGNINSSGIVNIPASVMSLEGTITLGVSGYYNGAIKTTEVLSYNIYEGTYTDVSDGDYETFEEIKNQMLAIQTQIEAAADDVSDEIAAYREELNTAVDAAIDEALGGSGVIEEIQEDIDELTLNKNYIQNLLQIGNIIVPKYNVITGEYVKYANGTIATSSSGNYNRTTPIQVVSGDIVHFDARSAADVSALAFAVANDSAIWERCIQGQSDSTTKTYEYTITQNGYIIISYHKNVGIANLYIIRGDDGENAIETLNNKIENKNSELRNIIFDLHSDSPVLYNFIESDSNAGTSPNIIGSGVVVDKSSSIWQTYGYRIVIANFIPINEGDAIKFTSSTAQAKLYYYSYDESSYLGASGWFGSELGIGEYVPSKNTSTVSYPCKIRILFAPYPNRDDNVGVIDSFTAADDVIPYLSVIRAGKNSDDSNTLTNINTSRRGKTILKDSDYPNLTSTYITNVKNNYEAFMSEVEGQYDKIPIIVFTDAHGGLTSNNKIFNLISDLTSWDEVSAIINLGDVVASRHDEIGVSQLKTYQELMDCIPLEKRIEVEGNHDGYQNGGGGNFNNNQYFKTIKAHRFHKDSMFSVTDDYFNVKYLAINPMSRPWTGENGAIYTNQANFIVEELSKTDRHDVVLISHPYLFKDNIVTRDDTTFTGGETFITTNGSSRQSFFDMLEARKNKTSGTFIDTSGVEHAYDFSNCKGNLLMSLHGHHHAEGYKTQNGITEFLFQSMYLNPDSSESSESNCFYFAYIDRKTEKFKCWKNIVGYDTWEIDI